MHSVSMSVVTRYKELGFDVHPCCPANHGCSKPGKVPFDPSCDSHLKGWQYSNRGTESWKVLFELGYKFNLGFKCGSPSSVVCIDIDDDGGWEILNDISNMRPHHTWQFNTGNGRRILYRLKPEEKFRSIVLSDNDGNQLEILGERKQSVCPPSQHANGKQYAWIDGFSPRDIECADAPDWLRELEPTDVGLPQEIDWNSVLENGADQGGRNEHLTKLAGHLMSPGAITPDECYWWLKLYNETRCNPKLPESELQTIVASIFRRESRQESHRQRMIKIAELMKDFGYTKQQAEAYLDSME